MIPRKLQAFLKNFCRSFWLIREERTLLSEGVSLGFDGFLTPQSYAPNFFYINDLQDI